MLCSPTGAKTTPNDCSQRCSCLPRASLPHREGPSLEDYDKHLLWVGQGVGPSIVSDGDEALLNVNVGCAILAHRPKLYQVALWGKFLQDWTRFACANS